MKKNPAILLTALGLGLLAVVTVVLIGLFSRGGTGGDAVELGAAAPAVGPERPNASLASEAESTRAERNAELVERVPGMGSGPAGPAASEGPIDPRSTVVIGRVIDAADRPLAGARVDLAGAITQSVGLESARALGRLLWEARATTGGGGTFRFEDVPSFGLRLMLEVSAEGHPGIEVPTLEAVQGGVLDLGDLRLAAGGGVAGTVLDDLGNPVAGAEVRWMEGLPPALGFLWRLSEGQFGGTTDSAGNFAIDRLPPGELRLAATSEEFTSSWSLPVRIGEGERVEGVELVVERGRPIVGRVVAADGSPLAAILYAWPEGGEGLVLSGRSDADGQFSLPGAPYRSRYTLNASAPGQREKRMNRVRLPAAGEPDEPVLLEMLPAVSFSLTVLDDRTGEPVPGARLAWAGQNGPGGFGGLERNGLKVGDARVLGRTGADGRLTLEGVAHPSRAVIVAADGYAPKVAHPGVSGEDRELLAVELTVRLDPGGALNVTVADSLGGVEGAEVELRQVSGWLGSRGGNRRSGGRDYGNGVTRALLARATTDAQGQAVFGQLPADVYAVVAGAPEHARILGEELEIAVGSSQHELRLYLPREARLAGRVRVRDAPAPGQRVIATASNGFEYETLTDDSGSYSLGGLPPDTYQVLARLPSSSLDMTAVMRGFAGRIEGENAVEVVLYEGEERALDLLGESRGQRLSGVLRINHELRPGLRVRARQLDEASSSRGRADWVRQNLSPTATTDAEGRFVLDGLIGGQWEVVAEQSGGRSGTKLVRMVLEMPEDADLERDLEGRTSSLSVRSFVEDTEQPRRGVRFFLRVDDERGGVPGFSDREAWSFSCDSEGRFVAEDLPEGAYTLQGSDRRYVSAEYEVELISGRPEELEVPLIRRE